MCFGKTVRLWLFLCVICFGFCIAKTVYIIPASYQKDPNESDAGLFAKLKKALNILGYECKFISFHSVPDLPKQDLEYLILIDFSHHVLDFSRFPEIGKIGYTQHVKSLLQRFDKSKLVLMCFEPEAYDAENHDSEIHKIFGKIITCYDSFKGAQYYKFYYPVALCDLSTPRIAYKKRKLATLINGCKTSTHPNEIYSERLNVINFFEKMRTKDFDFYGVGWDKNKYKNYHGDVPDKIEVLKKYRFCYCFENTKNVTGYISEKILDCLNAGCVPIYWGATNIDWYIPKNCYILREDFGSWNEIYNFIKNMTEVKYNEYLDNIKNYLASDAKLVFSCENFLDSILNAICPGYDRSKVFGKNEIVHLEKKDKWIIQNLKSTNEQ